MPKGFLKPDENGKESTSWNTLGDNKHVNPVWSAYTQEKNRGKNETLPTQDITKSKRWK